jgi:hypothetical protein
LNSVRKPVVKVISVLPDEGYEIDNGLLGVKRDLFNKLTTHRWSDDNNLQQMFGISG